MRDEFSLRPLHTDDVAAVLSGFQSDPAMKRQGDVNDVKSSRRYVDIQLSAGRISWAIVNNSDTLIGLIGINLDQQNHNGWFYYWIHNNYRGRGLTSRAAATVANWALTTGNLHRLEMGHRIDNPHSAGVAKAAGFIREGMEREKFLVNGSRIDVVTYGRLKTDPFPSTDALPMKTD